MENRKEAMRITLAESLRTLMVRKLFEKITIRQICDEAGVIRATFYNYFDDKYDCLQWIVYHDITENILKSAAPEQFVEGLKEGFRTIEMQRDFYRIAYNVTGQNSFEDMVRGNLKKVLLEYFSSYRREDYLPQYGNELIAEYYAEGMAFAVRTFACGREISSSSDMIRMITDLMKSSFTDFTEEK